MILGESYNLNLIKFLKFFGLEFLKAKDYFQILHSFHATGLLLHPLRLSEIRGFLMFSGGTERDQWHKMGQGDVLVNQWDQTIFRKDHNQENFENFIDLHRLGATQGDL